MYVRASYVTLPALLKGELSKLLFSRCCDLSSKACSGLLDKPGGKSAGEIIQLPQWSVKQEIKYPYRQFTFYYGLKS